MDERWCGVSQLWWRHQLTGSYKSRREKNAGCMLMVAWRQRKTGISGGASSKKLHLWLESRGWISELWTWGSSENWRLIKSWGKRVTWKDDRGSKRGGGMYLGIPKKCSRGGKASKGVTNKQGRGKFRKVCCSGSQEKKGLWEGGVVCESNAVEMKRKLSTRET